MFNKSYVEFQVVSIARFKCFYFRMQQFFQFNFIKLSPISFVASISFINVIVIPATSSLLCRIIATEGMFRRVSQYTSAFTISLPKSLVWINSSIWKEMPNKQNQW